VNTLSDTDAACVTTILSLCFKTKRNRCWTTAWHTQSQQYMHENLVREKVIWANDHYFFVVVYCPLFDGILKIVNPTAATRNNNIGEAVNLIQRLSITLR